MHYIHWRAYAETVLLAYLDESHRHDLHGVSRYLMGALIVNDQQVVQIERGLDRVGRLVARQVPEFHPESEFHGYDMFQGKGSWSDVPTSLRVRACQLAVRVIADAAPAFVLRCVNVDGLKRRYTDPFPEHDLALWQTLESIQKIMTEDHSGEQPVLVLADEHHSAPGSRSRFRAMRTRAQKGYTKVPLECLVDTIYFGPSEHSRLLQAIDIATFFKGRYEHNTEPDARAAGAMGKIKTALEPCCRYYYAWLG